MASTIDGLDHADADAAILPAGFAIVNPDSAPVLNLEHVEPSRAAPKPALILAGQDTGEARTPERSGHQGFALTVERRRKNLDEVRVARAGRQGQGGEDRAMRDRNGEPVGLDDALGGGEPIIDAHHHFRDLDRNYHPWLCDKRLIEGRHGDYRAIRHSYLPDDYRRDWSGLRIVGSVYVEAEWNPLDPLGETAWAESVAEAAAFPPSSWPMRGSPVPTRTRSWPHRRGIRGCGGYARSPSLHRIRTGWSPAPPAR